MKIHRMIGLAALTLAFAATLCACPASTVGEGAGRDTPHGTTPAVTGQSGADTTEPAGTDTLREEPDYVPDEDGVPYFNLSTRGRNVVILFIDRALGEDWPYLMNERPDLAEIYDGFTYYSNVISYGGHTNFGAPPVLGGYEYTPVEMNKRSDELLVDKHNESMKVMPMLFLENGFSVTVCDAPYGNYQWVSDLSVYDDCPEIKKFMTTGYFEPDDPSVYGIFGKDFVNSWEALKNLTAITNVRDNSNDNFVLFYNDTPHQVMKFREPDYVPDAAADNSAYDAAHADRFVIDGLRLKVTTENRMNHYLTNMATMLEIGKWLDLLRENGAYDNTKIIIVADHGYYLHQLAELDFPEHRLPQGDHVDIGNYFPLLLVKDFDAHGYSASDEFMTNADVPVIAFEGTVENPVNPFTGKAITSDEKTAHDQFIITNHDGWSTKYNNGCRFSACSWAAVTNNIWDRGDWKFIDDFVVLTEHEMP